MINNEEFWRSWREGDYQKALNMSPRQGKRRKSSGLFGIKNSSFETDLVAGISAGEFLYDYIMIDPLVVKGIDFARAEDLSSLFSLSRFAERIDRSVSAGDLSQLQGYVAEQMVAQRLESMGHDVQFPQTSNQKGWDLLVDGEKFQVKNVSNKSAIDAHLAKHPDIPVYINEELSQHYSENPNVFVSGISREEVLENTTNTLKHAEDILDFEIPWIAGGVSSFYNIRKVMKEETSLTIATRNVVIETASRASLAVVGQSVFTHAALSIFTNGAYVVVLPIVGAYIGLKQSSKASLGIKKLLAKNEFERLAVVLMNLVYKMKEKLELKRNIKREKWNQVTDSIKEGEPISELNRMHLNRLKYIKGMNKELDMISKNLSKDSIQSFEKIMNILLKSGIHVYTLKNELQAVEHALNQLRRKL